MRCRSDLDRDRTVRFVTKVLACGLLWGVVGCSSASVPRSAVERSLLDGKQTLVLLRATDSDVRMCLSDDIAKSSPPKCENENADWFPPLSGAAMKRLLAEVGPFEGRMLRVRAHLADDGRWVLDSYERLGA
jgi:hypothetical protein